MLQPGDGVSFALFYDELIKTKKVVKNTHFFIKRRKGILLDYIMIHDIYKRLLLRLSFLDRPKNRHTLQILEKIKPTLKFSIIIRPPDINKTLLKDFHVDFPREVLLCVYMCGYSANFDRNAARLTSCFPMTL